MMNEVVDSEASALISTLLVEEDSVERWFDFGKNPSATEQVGKLIADRAHAYAPDAVASWSSPDETVLAHIVARELGAVRVGIELDLGLLSVLSELPAASRVMLISTFWNRVRPVASLRTLLEGQGHTVVAAASLVISSAGFDDAGDLPLIRLSD